MPFRSSFLNACLSAANRFLFAGPALIVLVWFAAGQWESAGPEPRAWLRFAGVLCIASLMWLPGCSASLARSKSHLRWWGWVVVLGLLVTL